MAEKDKQPKGVRGPGGPPPPPRPTQPSAGRRPPAGGSRSSLERASTPLLLQLRRIPRWIMVVLPAVLLFGGLVMPVGLAWLGGLLLALVGVFLGWLLLLSWPVLSMSSRLLRLIVIVAVFGIAFIKAMGRI